MRTSRAVLRWTIRVVWIAALLISFCTASTVTSHAQTLTTLYSFCSQPNCTDGEGPNGGLVQGSDGNFYGTTYGSPSGPGTVFKISPSGTLTILYTFCSLQYCADGESPLSGLVQGSDGNFYGTTNEGGTQGSSGGTVFRMTPNGVLTTLYRFCSQPNCSDGQYPTAPLVQGGDGNFYGTTSLGGAHQNGTVFKITSNGTLTTLHSFSDEIDGINPGTGLVQANDGSFYGATEDGGPNGPYGGTIFRITAAGALTTVYSFCSQPNCADGWGPSALVQASDGSLYGTTGLGGNNNDCDHGCGTVFKITLSGTLTTLRDNPADVRPGGALVQATDGNFYGTGGGGSQSCQGGCGMAFKMTPSGTVTTLHNFDGADGAAPTTPMLQATDGNFYGTTLGGGSNCLPGVCGTVYKLSTGLPPFVTTQPSIGQVGTPVSILGTNLTGATSVTFNGTPAPILTNTGSAITTAVPAGATTGTVQVTTLSGTQNSDTVFQVTGPLQLISITPCRLVDTRQNGGPIQGGTSRNFTVSQLGGCGIPASAAAYSLNVTVVPHGPLAYLTIWPAGEIEPNVSTMNSLDGRIKANAAIVPASNNAETVYVTNTADLVLDIDGYFASPSQSTLQFFPLTPCRVADTRSGSYPQGLGTPHLSAGVARDFPVLNSSCIPTGINATAYSFNFTAIPYPNYGDILGFLEVWPTGQQPQNPVSTLNNLTGTYVANAAIVPAGTNGDITTYPSSDTDLAIDINGYFATTGSGGLSLYPTIPCRVIDTRKIGSGQPFTGTLSPPVDVVDSPCGIPAAARAYVFNATVVPSGSLSYLTLWPDTEQKPIVSTLNAADGWITSNMAIVPNIDGQIDAYAAGLTQLILDISGYFAP